MIVTVHGVPSTLAGMITIPTHDTIPILAGVVVVHPQSLHALVPPRGARVSAGAGAPRVFRSEHEA